MLDLDFIAQNFNTDTQNLPTHRILPDKNQKHKLTTFLWVAIINLTKAKPSKVKPADLSSIKVEGFQSL